MGHEKAHAPYRVQGIKHLGVLNDAVNPQPAQHHKPHHHDRAEQLADACCAMPLDQKQRHQHDQCERHHPALKPIERQLKPLNGGQNRNGWGDHAVAVKQRRSNQPENDQYRAQFRIRRRRSSGQRRQGHDPAFALVIGPQNKQHVLDRHHPNQRPQDQRQNAKHAIMVNLHAIATREHLFEGVKRAGANVAIYHPHSRHQHADWLGL